MKPHKWHKEIKAWADGAEIEQRYNNVLSSEWEKFNGDWKELSSWEYRIKPQPKEPQYLYVYQTGTGNSWTSLKYKDYQSRFYVGKIKLEVE